MQSNVEVTGALILRHLLSGLTLSSSAQYAGQSPGVVMTDDLTEMFSLSS